MKEEDILKIYNNDTREYNEVDYIWVNGVAYLPSCLNCKNRIGNKCPLACVDSLYFDEVCNSFEFELIKPTKDLHRGVYCCMGVERYNI